MRTSKGMVGALSIWRHMMEQEIRARTEATEDQVDLGC